MCIAYHSEIHKASTMQNNDNTYWNLLLFWCAGKEKVSYFVCLRFWICIAARKLSILLVQLNISSACSKEVSTFCSSLKNCKPAVTVSVGVSSSPSTCPFSYYYSLPSFAFTTVVTSPIISSKVYKYNWSWGHCLPLHNQ